MELVQEQINTRDVLKHYWGYESFRPLQEEVIASVMAGKDSLTMLPTGAGKSLCFQLPALIKDGMAVVISPLISLMKDQVDGLIDMGIATAYLNSSVPSAAQRSTIARIMAKEIKLLYISPERLQFESTLGLLHSANVSFFVIDEAHCISHWGHDFREDYRNLAIIKKNFTRAAVHSFTATATKEVQRDIVEQLGLDNPALHIGHIDRPNLTYRVKPRSQILNQIIETLKKHPNEPGIIYCLRRDDVDKISEKLNGLGFKNLPYHAGLSDKERHINQDRFAAEEVDIIVATIAFGMGIDRSNIRFIIHAAMPKSIEHYHQETGRAGRDGLPSYCYMFYGGGDFRTFSSFISQSPNREVMLNKLRDIYRFCAQAQCRHKTLANYFGQEYKNASCEGCDYCLRELEMVADALTVGQKILSCVVRVRQDSAYGFGADHITSVLMGKSTEQVRRQGHQSLSTFGIMSGESVGFIRSMIEQLLGQGYLERDHEFSTLSLTGLGWEVLSGKAVPALAKPPVPTKKKEIAKKFKEKREKDWGSADKGLFGLLREKRAEIARQKGVPAYIIFGDRALLDMSAKKPVNREQFAEVFGVGEAKLEAYGEIFTEIIKRYIKK